MFVDINSLLPKFIRRFGLSVRMGEEEIKMTFKGIIDEKFGSEKSSSVRPVYLKGKVLIVASLSSDFVQVLADKEREIINEINNKMGKEAIQKIEYLA